MKLTRIAISLLCTVAPVAALTQEVTLESPDQFISVDGEIIDYDGFMVRVDTAVGAISLPASEVICFGEGCFDIINNNNFGLTADAFISVIASAEEAAAAAPQADFTIAFGAENYGTVYGAMARAFAASGTTANVTISAEGAVALSDPQTGTEATVIRTDDIAAADMIIASVSLEGTEPTAFDVNNGWIDAQSMSHHLLGLQAFAVIVAPTSGVDRISMTDLARVYAGEVSNWSQIGGADVNVLPLQLPRTSPLRAEMEALVMAPAGKSIAGNVLTMADETGIAASISQFPGSISIVSAAKANDALSIPVTGACGIAVAATPFNIVSGDYPLIRPVMAAYGSDTQNPLVTQMFDYAATPAGQTLMAASNLMSIEAFQQDNAQKNGRLGGLLDAELDETQRNAAAQMFQVLFNADRLSPTLIGGATSSAEGAWNRAMLQSVIAAMSDPANAGREIIFVGKGASDAGSQAALDASVAAAQAMQSALTSVAGDLVTTGEFTITSYGFGDVSPATCTDGQVEGTEHARVEVWIR